MPHVPDDSLDLHLFRVWRRATNAVFRSLKKDMATYGLTEENFILLEYLYHKGPHTMQHLCEAFSIPVGSITYVIDKLEKKGHIQRQPCPLDRRVTYVVLTDEGKLSFDHIFPSHARMIAQIFSVVSAEQKTHLIMHLKKIGLHANRIHEDTFLKGGE